MLTEAIMAQNRLASLENLPNEVLLRIFLWAKRLDARDEKDDPSTLTQITLACQKFRSLAELVRYHDVQLRPFSEDDCERNEGPFRSSHLHFACSTRSSPLH